MIEIACDESGAEGEKLVGGVTDVFAHASVRLDLADADRCVRELRDWIRSPAIEYKANHLLRSKNRSALEWFLGESGPVFGRAYVHLVDKALFLDQGGGDPLYPAIVRAVALWGGPVSIIHDRQRSLTDDRIARLKAMAPGLASMTLVASRSDARVQVADFLAGVARRVAEDRLNGRGDAALVELLRPYVDPCSVWHPIGFA